MMSQDMLITLGGISSDTLLEVALSEQPEGGRRSRCAVFLGERGSAGIGSKRSGSMP